MNMMRSDYTVAGIINHASGELWVAGVYEGDLASVETVDRSPAGFHRYAVTVEAETPDQAEILAVLSYRLGGEPAEVTADMLGVGDAIVEQDGGWVTVDRIGRDDSGDSGDVLVWFVDQDIPDPAVYDPSAMLVAVTT